MNYVTIGCTPYGEDCAQVGEENYQQRARRECSALIGQLRRIEEEPEGARLAIKSFPHDLGNYLEVVCYFDKNNDRTIEYAFNMEGSLPMEWDAIAREELSDG